MRTQQSKRYTDLLFGSLNKVEFEEEAHPRDATGKFAPKGEARAEPAESAPRNLRSLAREASALWAMGDDAEARRVEQKLQAMRGGAEQRRQARMPKPLVPPRPQPAPKPMPAPVPVRAPEPAPAPAPPPAPKPAPQMAVAPLSEADAAERRHEMMRIDNARDKAQAAANPRQKFKDIMIQRMNAIEKPEKMMRFGHALAHAGEPVLAEVAFDRLRKMGFDPDGRPNPGIAPAQAQHLVPPKPAPEPPKVVPGKPPLAPPDRKQREREKVIVERMKRDASGFDDLERDVRDRLLRVKNQQNDPQKVRNFANELESQGEDYLAEVARNVLWDMGYKPDGSPVPEGERFARPAHGVQRPIPPPPPPPLPEAKPATGMKHPMAAVHDSGAVMKDAQVNFHDKIHKAKEMGGGIGETHRIEFKNGTKAIYKPTKGSGLQRYHEMHRDVRHTLDWKIPEGKREAVAFAISQAAGFDIVPHVELVNYPVGSPGGGHAMAWVDGMEAARAGNKLNEDSHNGHPDLHRIAALDFIMCNTDRHGGNFMAGKDGRWYAIDNGLAGCRDMETGEYNSMPHHAVKGKEIPKEVKDEINSIRSESLAEVMRSNGFANIDVEGAVARLDHLKGISRWGGPYEDMQKMRRAHR